MSFELQKKLKQLDIIEVSWCAKFNQKSQRHSVVALFSLVSRMGNGVFWYSLMASLPIIWGLKSIPVVFKMTVAGVVGVLIYKSLKTATRRQRPCVRHEEINNPVLPLDEYSFPSGHTLHAVAFTVIAGAHFPVLLWMLVPLAILIAISRLVLGLHYPSDVIAGAVIGGVISAVVLMLSTMW